MGMGTKKIVTWVGSSLIMGVIVIGAAFTVNAQTPPSDFSLQVTPSPLVATLKPGTTTELELKIRNAGTSTENLKIVPRSFTVDKKTGEVKLDDTAPAEISPWISYSDPTFTIKPGEWFTQKVRISLPKNSGFSYSFAQIISRANNPDPTSAGRLIKGSLAVFTLINVDRPGATRSVAVTDYSTTQPVYEYLPATIETTFKNTGNTIVQPYGNVFIQHSTKDTTPISTLPVNDKKGYILPGSERTLDTQWTDGFPYYKITKLSDGTEKRTEVWDWSKVSQFRIGRYTAKLVAVYNDGKRDIPIEKEITFWILPWKIMLGALVIVGILAFGIWTILRKLWTTIRRGKKRKSKTDK